MKDIQIQSLESASKNVISRTAREQADKVENPILSFAQVRKLEAYLKEFGSRLRPRLIEQLKENPEGVEAFGAMVDRSTSERWDYVHCQAWRDAKKELDRVSAEMKEIESLMRKKALDPTRISLDPWSGEELPPAKRLDPIEKINTKF